LGGENDQERKRECVEKRASYTYVGVRKISKGESGGAINEDGRGQRRSVWRKGRKEERGGSN